MLYEWYQKYLPGKGSTVGRVLGLMKRFGIESVEGVYENTLIGEFKIAWIRTKKAVHGIAAAVSGINREKMKSLPTRPMIMLSGA